MNNLTIDCNYILHKNVHTLHKYNMLYGELWNALDRNIEKYAIMNNWENINIVSDSRKKSWRVKHQGDYKAKRVTNNDIDWKFCYETYNEWKESIKEKYNVFERDHIEGDDWITFLTLGYNKKYKGNVIISSDEDLLQLIKYKIKGDKSFINLQIKDHSGNEKLFIPEGYQIFEKHYTENNGNDVFELDGMHENIQFLDKTIQLYNVQEVDNYGEFFKKLVMGDKSDNISSIYQSLTSTNKIQNLGKATAQKMWDYYKENISPIYDTKQIETLYDNIIESLEHVKKLDLDDNKIKNVKENIDQNIQMMELHHRHYPEFVLEQIVEKLEKHI